MVSWDNIPSDFQYFSDVDEGGLSNFNEFCPIHQVWGSKWVDFEWICFDDSKGQSLDTLDIFSLNSRCSKVKFNSDNDIKDVGVCFKHNCIGYNNNTGLYNSIDIDITGTDITINCHRNDKNTWKPTGISSITQIFCPNIDAICQSSQPFACKFGFYKDTLNKCVCSPGYEGDICDTQTAVNIAAANKLSTLFMIFCVFVFSLFIL